MNLTVEDFFVGGVETLGGLPRKNMSLSPVSTSQKKQVEKKKLSL